MIILWRLTCYCGKGYSTIPLKALNDLLLALKISLKSAWRRNSLNMNQQQGFNPTFENGGFWEYYKDLERQFESFLDYVPYLKVNENTYSFRLANILLGIGGYIDSAFKEMARSNMFAGVESCKEILKRAEDKSGIIVSAIRAFDEIYGISSKQVIFKCLPERIPITPFEGDKPEWWDFYNDIKHDITPSFSKANLKNVRDALAGAFLLNVIFEPSISRLDKHGIVKDKYQLVGHKKEHIFSRGKFTEIKFTHVLDNSDDCLIETPIFIYEYVYEKQKEPVS